MATVSYSPSSRYIDYDTLNFVPLEDKNKEEYAAEWIAYAKQNSKQFVNEKTVQKYRALDRGDIDEAAYKDIIDPVDESGEGGEAEFFVADYKSNPIFNHLNTIIEAGLEKIPINLYVKASDEYSQSELHKENARILGRDVAIAYINDMNAKMGFPPLPKGTDPFRYIKSMKPSGKKGETAPGGKVGVGDIPVNIMDSIKSFIQDDEDMALFNEYIWKDGVEIAIEIGLKHYMNTVNRFSRIGERLIKDIKNFNRTCMRWYTSKTTGLPIFEYMQPHALWTSEFTSADGSDITHWYTEYEINYGDFVRMFGAKLTKEELIEVFELNRGNHGITTPFEKTSSLRRATAKIRYGYLAFESQDMEVFSESYVNGNKLYERKPSDYKPSEDEEAKYNATRVEKHYNVWRECYYLPLAGSSVNAGAVDFSKQARYIYGYGKIQDQKREGDDFKYTKNSLVMWASDAMSFSEIMARYMGKINLLWFQFQNDLANVIPHGMMFYKEFMELALTSQDDAKDGKDATTKFIKKLKQTGVQIGKLFTEQGTLNNQLRPYDEIKTGHLASAIEKFNTMMMLYEAMKQSLGISDSREGKDPAPRTPSAGIKIALQASSDSTYYVEKAYTNIITELGTRLMYYINDIVNEPDSSERLQDFIDVVGKANGLAIESIRKIPMHKLALTVANVMTDEQKAKLQNMVDQMAVAGMIDMDIALFLETVDNLKYAYAIVRLALKKKQREQQAQKEAEAQQVMQLKQMDLQISQAQAQEKLRGEMQIIQLEKKLEGWLLELETKLKTQGQTVIKDKIKDNRIEENIANVQIEKNLVVDNETPAPPGESAA